MAYDFMTSVCAYVLSFYLFFYPFIISLHSPPFPLYPFQGLLNGYDQATNLILTSCHERIFSMESGVAVVQLGLYIIRGDNM